VAASLLNGWLLEQGSSYSARAQHGQHHHGETIFACNFLAVETVMIAQLDMEHSWSQAREEEDQIARLRRDRWPTRAPVRLSPGLAGELSMPAKQRRRRHDQTSAALRREQPSERREERSV
jgi:hypothetical protein